MRRIPQCVCTLTSDMYASYFALARNCLRWRELTPKASLISGAMWLLFSALRLAQRNAILMKVKDRDPHSISLRLITIYFEVWSDSIDYFLNCIKCDRWIEQYQNEELMAGEYIDAGHVTSVKSKKYTYYRSIALSSHPNWNYWLIYIHANNIAFSWITITYCSSIKTTRLFDVLYLGDYRHKPTIIFCRKHPWPPAASLRSSVAYPTVGRLRNYADKTEVGVRPHLHWMSMPWPGFIV